LLDAAGTVLATARLHRARFRITVAQPGRYTLKLLGDGRTTRGLVFAVSHATARSGQTSRVVFLLQVP
jgi:cation transport regulator ChaC